MKMISKALSRSTSFLSRSSIHTINTNGYEEQVYQRSDYPLESCKKILKGEKFAILGYGPQGRGQSLNLKDNGFDVVIGLRKGGTSYAKALEDGWVEGKNLLPIDEAANQGSVVQYLLSDAGQIKAWPGISANLKDGDALYFSHGFGIVFNDQTNIIPNKNLDVILVAPKGPGAMVRDLFVAGSGMNASYAVHQDSTGRAKERCLASAFAIGVTNLYETTFEREVHSDLTGERGVLMGAIQGIFKAQYDVLRAKGHSPTECFNETVEEALVSLYPLINNKGMDWMYRNCSTTAQRGALDWAPKFYDANKPVFEKLYQDVVDQKESKISIDSNSDPDYRAKLEVELAEVDAQEIWKVGKEVRKLRA